MREEIRIRRELKKRWMKYTGVYDDWKGDYFVPPLGRGDTLPNIISRHCTDGKLDTDSALDAITDIGAFFSHYHDHPFPDCNDLEGAMKELQKCGVLDPEIQTDTHMENFKEAFLLNPYAAYAFRVCTIPGMSFGTYLNTVYAELKKNGGYENFVWNWESIGAENFDIDEELLLPLTAPLE